MLKPKACRLRTSNLVGGWSMRYQLSWQAIKACEVWLLHTGGGIPCRPHPTAAKQFVLLYLKGAHTSLVCLVHCVLLSYKYYFYFH